MQVSRHGFIRGEKSTEEFGFSPGPKGIVHAFCEKTGLKPI
jgi:hypothetical protein